MTADTEQRDAELTREQIASNLLAWIADLETTKEPQTKGRLYRSAPDAFYGKPVGYCCLGRAAMVRGYTLDDRGDNLLSEHGFAGYDFVKHDFGLTGEEVNTCWHMNDGEGKSFPEIAAWLRENVLPRYTDKAAVSPL